MFMYVILKARRLPCTVQFPLNKQALNQQLREYDGFATDINNSFYPNYMQF